jgi:hypothetical protein
MNKIDKDKKIMMDGLNSAGTSPRGLRKSISQNSVSGLSASASGMIHMQE